MTEMTSAPTEIQSDVAIVSVPPGILFWFLQKALVWVQSLKVGKDFGFRHRFGASSG